MRWRDLLAIAALSLSSPGCSEDAPVPPPPPVAPESEVMDFSDEIVEEPEYMDFSGSVDAGGLEIEVEDALEGEDEATVIKRRLAGRGGSASKRMHSVCAARNEGLEDGFVRLILITPYWTSQAMSGGAVYVRGGRTNEGKCTNRAQPDYVERFMKKYTDGYQRPEECRSLRSKGCTSALQKMYQERVVDHFSGRYLCADCTTYLLQLFDCAFGTTQPYRTQPTTAPIIAATPGAIKGYAHDSRNRGDRALFNSWTDRQGKQHWGSPRTPDMGSCWEMISEQIGGLQFGDIIQFPGHFALYTGGIGLDYEIVEMGAYAFSGTEIETGYIPLRFNNQRIPGVRVISDAQEALDGPHVRRGCVVRRVSSRPSKFDYRAIERR